MKLLDVISGPEYLFNSFIFQFVIIFVSLGILIGIVLLIIHYIRKQKDGEIE